MKLVVISLAFTGFGGDRVDFIIKNMLLLIFTGMLGTPEE